jgi:hypothetical protein
MFSGRKAFLQLIHSIHVTLSQGWDCSELVSTSSVLETALSTQTCHAERYGEDSRKPALVVTICLRGVPRWPKVEVCGGRA